MVGTARRPVRVETCRKEGQSHVLRPPPSSRRRGWARRPRTSGSGFGRRFLASAPGYTLIEMIGVVIIAAILLKMVVPNLLGGSEAARKNTLLNDLKGFHSQAALHFNDWAQFPTGIQASGTPTAITMTYATSPGVGLKITGVSQSGYTVRARSTELRLWECTMTISKTSGYNPVCTQLAAEWAGTDPSA
jgi:type II secretory pathway pseudopilin PulG